VVWVAGLLPLLGWWLTGLTDLDEGYYGAVVSEMIRRGEWITPFYNGHPWFEKPILLYWVAKPCMMLFGDAIGPRLPSVLATAALYALVAWFCRRRLTEEKAQVAVLVLASCILVAAIGRLMLTDALLNLCICATFLFFWEAADNPRFRWLSGLALGMAVLAKGPVSIIFFVGVVGTMAATSREFRSKLKGGWLGFFALFLAAVSSWYLPAWQKNGETFVQKFLIEQNLGRFTGGDSAHTVGGIQGLNFYAAILLLGMLPWSLWIPKAIRKYRDMNDLGQFQLIWAVFIFIFFTVSAAKLPHYILPAVVPLVILIANVLKPQAFKYAAACCVAMCIIANVAQYAWDVKSGQAEAHQWARYVRDQDRGQQVAMFQLTRRRADQATGTTDLQETSLPSMLMYLDQTVIDTDNLGELLARPGETWIFTRADRIGPAQFAQAMQAGRSLDELRPSGIDAMHYRLFRLR
jgi:4-amino-4-deoxy-L-arabinose transferase-like glycosyltransferase